MSIVRDIIQHLENCGIGEFGVNLRSRPDKESREGINWEAVFVKADPSFTYPKTSVNIDINRVRISVAGNKGITGYERCDQIIHEIYKVCRLQTSLTINGTFYPSIVAVQPPYESNFFTETGVTEMTIQLDVTRYTEGMIEYQCNKEREKNV